MFGTQSFPPNAKKEADSNEEIALSLVEKIGSNVVSRDSHCKCSLELIIQSSTAE